MIRELIWKEWRENRWKYATLWLVFNAPVLILTLLIGLIPMTRMPFADLSDKTVMKYLPLPLGEGFLVTSIFLLATAFVAVATFRPEIEDKAVFFLFEQPVSRRRYVAAKLLNGACHVTLAVCFAILLAPAVVYALMLISGKVTLAGSAVAFGGIMGAAARAMLWCSLVSLVAFTGSALISTLVPRWWLATVCAILFILLFGYYVHGDNRFFAGGDFFDFTPTTAGKSMSVSANLGTGTTQWLTVSDVFPMPTTFAPWKWLPVLTGTLLIALFSAGVAVAYDRKELK
jgi:ABC-type transport system involved in multi-copper enzyme maturation permease subunit